MLSLPSLSAFPSLCRVFVSLLAHITAGAGKVDGKFNDSCLLLSFRRLSKRIGWLMVMVDRSLAIAEPRCIMPEWLACRLASIMLGII